MWLAVFIIGGFNFYSVWFCLEVRRLVDYLLEELGWDIDVKGLENCVVIVLVVFWYGGVCFGLILFRLYRGVRGEGLL